MNTQDSGFSLVAGAESVRSESGFNPISILKSILSHPVLKPEERNFQAALLSNSAPAEDHVSVVARQADFDDEDYGRGYD
jgi:hypothetical protein